MQTLVTVVREGGQPQDVVVATDDTATAGDVARALADALGGTGLPAGPAGNVVALPYGHGVAAAGTPYLWADGERCDPQPPPPPYSRTVCGSPSTTRSARCCARANRSDRTN
ncbi:hypothetical protein SHKM778_06720 [Streptomyces sp. KM77-8]|uniref:Uncharacterized protein n=1 Tax=Streptomyces haneummycinicus TaxID=3074435 RepID=A0AAT9HA69_9ACTN